MPDRHILSTCGALGVVGALVPIATDVLSWPLAESYSPVSQSISALAVGRASWLIDLGLWIFALGCFAVGTGMFALRPLAAPWLIAAVATITIGIEAATVAVVNEYAGSKNAGADIHSWAIWLLYPSFAVAALGGRRRLRDLSSLAARYSLAAGWIWIVFAPVYYFWYPSGWAGAFERGLAILMIAWLLLVAVQFRAESARPPRAD
ncbi:DUF998 domain-containing protein [Jannaschia formosa]|uniref:DUF998 domain-containing protein n=1 Tax=Jannaschia formosa TaxID=2259592 RepID=UPI0014301E70|nr:DUF998 domain-containing protein [Jannaschia formosa]